MTEPHDPGMPRDGAASPDPTAGPDATADDAINTESVNDGEEAAPHPGAAPAGATGPDVVGDGTASGPGDAGGTGEGTAVDTDADAAAAQGGSLTGDAALAAERLGDLQRLQAEYVNYKRRVDRDRALVQERAVRDVLEAVLPVLDDIQAARDHGDLVDGPFAAIADKLESTLGKYGLERFGAKGETFDPMQHEALMHAPWPTGDDDLPADATSTTVVTVLQPGYRAGEQVLRPARVAVADPD
ncbi:MAG TPA: nucleotide exchange factor GrpE [Ornithinibacter sp.]|nr:nucleotide exchange factor GrpE [Ornithinibacter sp.]